MERKNIFIAPAGEFGTALAVVFNERGHQVTLGFRDKSRADDFNQTHQNTVELPGITLPESVLGTADLSKGSSQSDLIILAAPARFAINFYDELDTSNARVLLVSKGLDPESDKLIYQRLIEKDPSIEDRVAVMSGPNQAGLIAERKPTTTTIASANPENVDFIQDLLRDSLIIRAHPWDDPVGVAWCGVLKNIYALMAGASEGLDLGENCQASIVGRAPIESMRFLKAVGGNPDTFYQVCGIGDLFLSCAGDATRNYRAGRRLARGEESLEGLLKSNRTLEGLYSSLAVHKIAADRGIDMPLANTIYRVLYDGLSPDRALSGLMTRPSSKLNGKN